MYNDFEKAIYKELFTKFSNEEYHVEFLKNSYDGDFEILRLANDNDSICVELTENYCFNFIDL